MGGLTKSCYSRLEMLVLGIETTCDETAAAVVHRGADGIGDIRSNVVYSQIAEHKEFGGVVPEIAARAHVEVLDQVIQKALADAHVRLVDCEAVAAAAGPGLIGGVIVGLTEAKAIALAAKKKFVAVNHLEAHALSARLTGRVDFPFLLLLASGGHTQLVLVEDIGRYRKIGGTVDDALGEAFDKAGKMLGLGYPGGPAVEQHALLGDPERFELPRPMFGRAEPDFSLSGLKTALRVEAEAIAPLSDQDVNDLCASFQAAVIDVIADRVRVALRKLRDTVHKPTAFVVAGGVAANQAIRAMLEDETKRLDTPLIIPPQALCTDNGAMIAWAAAERLARGFEDKLDVAPRARWPLDENTTAA
jgi:N6-L-threonylcarbamoyladenine synthase